MSDSFSLKTTVDAPLLRALHAPYPNAGLMMRAFLNLSHHAPYMLAAILAAALCCLAALNLGISALLALMAIGAVSGGLAYAALASGITRAHVALWGDAPKQVALGDTVEAEFTARGFRNNWEGLESHVPWAHVTSIHDTPGFCYLHTTLGVVFVVPTDPMSIEAPAALERMRNWKDAT